MGAECDFRDWLKRRRDPSDFMRITSGASKGAAGTAVPHFPREQCVPCSRRRGASRALGVYSAAGRAARLGNRLRALLRGPPSTNGSPRCRLPFNALAALNAAGAKGRGRPAYAQLMSSLVYGIVYEFLALRHFHGALLTSKLQDGRILSFINFLNLCNIHPNVRHERVLFVGKREL